MEKNTVHDSDEYIKIKVESTFYIQDWIPVLIEMDHDDKSKIYIPLQFDEDYTSLYTSFNPRSYYSIEIITAVKKFNEYLEFFAKRTRNGDVISIWKSFKELNELIDKKKESDTETLTLVELESEHVDFSIDLQNKIDNHLSDIDHQLRSDMVPDQIKTNSAEELASELVEFIKRELTVKGRIWIPNHSRLFWEKLKVYKRRAPAEIQIKMTKAEELAQEIFDIEQAQQKRAGKKR